MTQIVVTSELIDAVLEFGSAKQPVPKGRRKAPINIQLVRNGSVTSVDCGHEIGTEHTLCLH